MASTAIHVPNMKEAIANSLIPGKFTEDRTIYEFPTLKYFGARGVIHFWTIRIRLIHNDAYEPITDDMLNYPVPGLKNYKAEIIVESMQKNGKIRDIIPTYVSSGKNIGKKNATNCITQAIRNALGLYNKQKKKVDIVSSASDMALDAEDNKNEAFDERPPPMLVKKIGDSREAKLTESDFKDGITVQRKLNGVHYVAFMQKETDNIIHYSRTGIEYSGQEQIVSEIKSMFINAPKVQPGEYGIPDLSDVSDLPDLSDKSNKPDEANITNIHKAYGILDNTGPSPYFDGELYLHGKSLNWISGQARRGDDEGKLEFHIFDVFFPYAKAVGHDMESHHRQSYIDAFFKTSEEKINKNHSHIVRVENFRVQSMIELNMLVSQFLKENYEGGIARKDKAGYKYGYNNYHSANLVKIKPILDDEFKVVGYSQGTRGKDVGAVIWECVVPNPIDADDKLFTVVPKDMTYEERYSIYKCLGALVDGPNGEKITRFERDVKGLPLTVEYREMSTKTGKPLQAKALAFRTYEGGPAKDPIKTLLDECLAT